MTSAINAIKTRTSCRTYDGSPLETRVREKLLDALARSVRGPFGNEVRLALVEPENGPRNGSYGTYGFIRGARAFLAGLVRRADGAYEDYGYCLEKVVLEATEWGLSTCWLGGTFRRADYARGLEAGPEDSIPAVTPVGRPSTGKRLFDRFTRMAARSSTRKPWESLFFLDGIGTPLAEEAAGRYRPCLDGVRLAPSAANRQPWRVVKENGKDAFTFLIDRPPARGGTSYDLRDVDLGIAMCHFELVAGELGLGGVWERAGPVPGAPWDPIACWIGKRG